MDQLTVIAVMAIVASGAFISMGEGMVLAPLGTLLWKVPEPFRHPLASCQRCMVSVWGTGAVFALGMMPEWYLLPVYWLCAAGLQELIQR